MIQPSSSPTAEYRPSATHRAVIAHTIAARSSWFVAAEKGRRSSRLGSNSFSSAVSAVSASISKNVSERSPRRARTSWGLASRTPRKLLGNASTMANSSMATEWAAGRTQPVESASRAQRFAFSFNSLPTGELDCPGLPMSGCNRLVRSFSATLYRPMTSSPLRSGPSMATHSTVRSTIPRTARCLSSKVARNRSTCQSTKVSFHSSMHTALERRVGEHPTSISRTAPDITAEYYRASSTGSLAPSPSGSVAPG